MAHQPLFTVYGDKDNLKAGIVIGLPRTDGKGPDYRRVDLEVGLPLALAGASLWLKDGLPCEAPVAPVATEPGARITRAVYEEADNYVNVGPYIGRVFTGKCGTDDMVFVGIGFIGNSPELTQEATQDIVKALNGGYAKAA